MTVTTVAADFFKNADYFLNLHKAIAVGKAIIHNDSLDFLMGLTDNPMPYERSRKRKRG